MNNNENTTALITEICGVVADAWRYRITVSGASPGRNEADRFRNIRGFIIEDTIEWVLAGIAGDCGRDIMIGAMETYMKIQALEAPSPEAAVDFLEQLKCLVNETAARDSNPVRAEAAREINGIIEKWITVAAEMYHEYRELLPRLKHQEKVRTEIRNLNFNKEKNREVPR